MLEQLKRFPYLSLVLMASYAAYEMPPDQRPYAFSASAFGIIFGFYGLAGGEEMQCSVVKAVVDTSLDFIPLSLMNIEIFLAMGKPYAMVHALFIIPLILDVIAKLFGDEGDDEATQMLKHVNNFANVASLAILSYMDANYMYATVALSFLTAQSAKIWGGKSHVYISDMAYVMAYNVFFYTSVLALTVPNEMLQIKKESINEGVPAARVSNTVTEKPLLARLSARLSNTVTESPVTTTETPVTTTEKPVNAVLFP